MRARGVEEIEHVAREDLQAVGERKGCIQSLAASWVTAQSRWVVFPEGR